MGEFFRRFSNRVSAVVGTPWAFLTALSFIAVWAVTGPLFGFSDTWQLVVNTASSVVTFLMVFVLQNTVNRDTRAIHVKLDELLRSVRNARNTVIDVEERPDQEIEEYHEELREVAEDSAKEAAGEAVAEVARGRPRGQAVKAAGKKAEGKTARRTEAGAQEAVAEQHGKNGHRKSGSGKPPAGRPRRQPRDE